MKAFILTCSLCCIVMSSILVYTRSAAGQIIQMHQWYDGVEALLIFGAIIGSFSIAIIATEMKWVARTGFGLLLATMCVMVLTQKIAGQTVGSAGWGVTLIALTVFIPLSLIASLTSASVSLLKIMSGESKVRFVVFITLGIWFIVSSILFLLLTSKPNSVKIVSMLDHKSNRQRLNSIHLLSKIHDERAIKPLIRLANDPEEEDYIKNAAIWTLKEYLPEKEVIEFFLSVGPTTIKRAPEPVFYALGDIIGKGVDGFAPAALQKLVPFSEDNDELLRSIAIDALGASDAPEIIYLFIMKLEDTSPLVRFRAHEHLVRKSGKTWGKEPAIWKEWFAGNYPQYHTK